MTSVIALQATERLASTESLIDSVLQIQKQNDRAADVEGIAFCLFKVFGKD